MKFDKEPKFFRKRKLVFEKLCLATKRTHWNEPINGANLNKYIQKIENCRSFIKSEFQRNNNSFIKFVPENLKSNNLRYFGAKKVL